MRCSRRWCSGLAATLLSLFGVLALSVATAQASPTLPTQDPFYSYSGSLTGVANGTVLRSRTIDFDASGVDVPVNARQVLFKTTSELGAPIVAVTTVVEPTGGGTQKIVSYQWAYDGLASNCEPSYAIQGGSPTETTNPDEQMLSSPMLAAGDTVVITDYEGEANDFAAGRVEGQITLDGIRAAESVLSFPDSTQVALLGYSGGAIASDWASELAPSYAPGVNIVGTAMGGIAVDLDHNLNYVNGSQEWSGAIPAALIGISRAFDINLAPYLSSYGESIVNQVGASCLTSDLGTYPGLTLQKMLKPQYTNIDQVPAFVDAIDTLIMGTGGVPREPMFMGIGDTDGVGDDVMVLADDEALADKYCAEGLPVDFNVYKNEDHGNAGTLFLPEGINWVIGRLDGVPAMNGCSQIPAGDSLAPIAYDPPASAAVPQPRLALQYRGSRGRALHLRLRASGAAIARVRLELLSARGRLLAARTLRLPEGKLEFVSLASRTRLSPGRYRIVARDGRRTLASRTFTVKRR